jgi:hypothetical protein
MEEQTSGNLSTLALIKAPKFLGLLGFAIVLFAFLLAVVNALVPTPNAFIKAILQPMIFVGLASLLYHIGQHVHALHQNALRMFKMQQPHQKYEQEA